jgi:hypothetical protein
MGPGIMGGPWTMLRDAVPSRSASPSWRWTLSS